MELTAIIGLVSGITGALKAIKDLVSGVRTEIKKEDAEKLEKQTEELEKKIMGLASLARTVQTYRRLYDDSRTLEEGANNALKTMLTAPNHISVFARSLLSDIGGRFSKGLESSSKVIMPDIDSGDEGTISAYVNQLTLSLGRADGYVDSDEYERFKVELYKIGDVAAKVSGLASSRVELLLRELERLSLRR